MSLPPDLSFLADGGEMGRRITAFDWSPTPLGPIAGWPAALRTAVGICLASRHPMVIWWGPELVLLYNDAWVPILGRSKHPALGRPGEQVWPENWHIVGPELHGVLSTGTATWAEDQLLPCDRDGYLEEAYFTYSYSPIRDGTDGVVGVFTAVTETTARVLGERRMRALRALSDVTAVQTTTVEQGCAVAVEVLARNRADVPAAMVYLRSDDGHSARLVASQGVRPERFPAVVSAGPGSHSAWSVISSGEPLVATGVADRRAGGFLPGAGALDDTPPDSALVLPLAVVGQDRPAGAILLAINPHRVLDADYRTFLDLVAGQIFRAVGDATAYQAQRVRGDELAALDTARTTFFSNISHELRTPLALIMGPVQDLRDGGLDPAGARAELEVVHRNALRLGRLVDTLLDFSRLQAGRVEAAFEPVDLAVLTTELAAGFRSAVERAGLRFDVACRDLGEPVHVDCEMWEKVVLNLLSNALKFTFTGAVTVSLERDGDTALLRVGDTGTGIAESELPRLFERFHRVERARARSTEGSGIGLALVKELVELHGGAISVSSTVDAGSTFTVTLPIGASHLPRRPVAGSGSEAASGSVSGRAEPFVVEALRWSPAGDPASDDPTPGLGATSGEVLVADDNADMREYLQRLLGTRYAVRTVADGGAALRSAVARPPDLVVSDVMMPGLDGLGLLASLRSDPRTAHVPVLLLSARAGQEATATGLAAGADDYLMKPFSSRELLARVGAHLELGRVRRAAEDRFRAMADLAPAMIWISARPAGGSSTTVAGAGSRVGPRLTSRATAGALACTPTTPRSTAQPPPRPRQRAIRGGWTTACGVPTAPTTGCWRTRCRSAPRTARRGTPAAVSTSTSTSTRRSASGCSPSSPGRSTRRPVCRNGPSGWRACWSRAGSPTSAASCWPGRRGRCGWRSSPTTRWRSRLCATCPG